METDSPIALTMKAYESIRYHDKESDMNTLWQEKEFEQICSRESLTEKAVEIEKLISVVEHEKEQTREKNCENAFLLRVASVAKRMCDL